MKGELSRFLVLQIPKQNFITNFFFTKKKGIEGQRKKMKKKKEEEEKPIKNT